MRAESPFLHKVILSGKQHFFHSLTLELYDSPTLCPDPSAEIELLNRYRQDAGELSGIVMATLFLTTRCPRKCSYCFLQGVPEMDMTTAEVDMALDITGKGPADILLYGGEPLIRPDLVEHVARRVRNEEADVNLILATGGHPVDESLVELLASLDTFIIVSMDGPPSLNDRVRPLKGSSSFAVAENTFRSFRAAGCRVGISVTLTRYGIKNARRDFLWLMDRFQPDDMGLNPWLHPLEMGIPNPCQVSAEEAFQAVTECMEEAVSAGMYIEQLARRARPFVNRTPRLKDCASSGGRLVVMPGGTAGTCDCMTCRGLHGVPMIDTRGISSLLDTFRPLSPVNFKECLHCPALCICGGGCRYDGFLMTGDIRGSWQERCVFERRFLRWMIEKTVQQGRESLIPTGGFDGKAMPMPVGTMLGERS